MENEKNPLVTIICACYNQEKYILESLESVKNQVFKDFELIVWDDGSRDNSVKIIEDWILKNPVFHARFVKHSVNKGICASLNECFLLSRGKYIQILALDDTLMVDKLERHVNILEKSTGKDALVFSDALIIDENSTVSSKRFIEHHVGVMQISNGNFFTALLDINFIPAMSVLLKRSVIDDVGLWDEDLAFEDYDMWLRIAKKYDFIYDDSPSVSYRLHSSNTHKVLSNTLMLSWFKMLLKFSDIPSVKKKLQNVIEHNYVHKTSNGEEKLYFEKFPVSSIKDFLFLNNIMVPLFLVLRKLNSFIKI